MWVRRVVVCEAARGPALLAHRRVYQSSIGYLPRRVNSRQGLPPMASRRKLYLRRRRPIIATTSLFVGSFA